MKRIFAVLAMVLFAAVSVRAQEARWDLLRAEYGSGDSFVDVTARLRSLTQDGVLSIRVDNGTLGGDPVPGAPKVLRIRVRDDNGRERVLTYPEKESIRLYLRQGYGDRDRDRDDDRDRDRREGPRGPAYGGGLQILRADYGADGRFSDVTARLASRVRGDALSLRVTNDAMGGDPAEDRPKLLQVWYSYNGRAASVVVNEREVLNLPAEADAFSGRLRIMRAQYGVGHRYADVTDLLNSRIQGDRLILRVENSNMGGDPDPNQRKQLVVFYVFDGRASRMTVNEKSELVLPPAGGEYITGPAGGLEILQASYGAGDRRRDVTERLAAQVRGDSLQLVVSNSSMGGDPADGQRKRLRVIYFWQGARNEITVAEGETLLIP